ncbi:hypothetical protein ACJJTC_015008, partial [Scirpophaga incertulas]
MRLQTDRVDEAPTMCANICATLTKKMEGTVDGMKLAIPAPSCRADGSFEPRQCLRRPLLSPVEPAVPGADVPHGLRLRVRAGRGPLPRVPLPRRGAPACACGAGRACALVDVACDADYCPPVPACLPRKQGQCPYHRAVERTRASGRAAATPNAAPTSAAARLAAAPLARAPTRAPPASIAARWHSTRQRRAAARRPGRGCPRALTTAHSSPCSARTRARTCWVRGYCWQR